MVNRIYSVIKAQVQKWLDLQEFIGMRSSKPYSHICFKAYTYIKGILLSKRFILFANVIFFQVCYSRHAHFHLTVLLKMTLAIQKHSRAKKVTNTGVRIHLNLNNTIERYANYCEGDDLSLHVRSKC